jgi:hypothetical protein
MAHCLQVIDDWLGNAVEQDRIYYFSRYLYYSKKIFMLTYHGMPLFEDIDFFPSI